ncbi:hypothetical protein NDU88_006622 [Pleurodeles waltl]|uniref:Uncharacterized protein n=1 Tax=Pleurodeles waltl TaxID=8319 RepID=A0AAV7QJK6_PLEWA|nr:hypothetical protein NDU88_006622 [Pleurodeles waltl]
MRGPPTRVVFLCVICPSANCLGPVCRCVRCGEAPSGVLPGVASRLTARSPRAESVVARGGVAAFSARCPGLLRDPPGVRLVLAGTLGLVLGAWFKAVPGSRRAVGAVPRGAGACLRCIGRAFGAGSKAQLSLGSRRAGSAVPQAEPPALRESRERPTFAFPGNRSGRPGNLVLGLLAGRVRGRVAAAVRSPASSGQRGGVSLSARRSEDTGESVGCWFFVSSPLLLL